MKYLKFLFLAIVIVCLSISFYNIFTLDRTNTDLNTKLEQTEKTYSGRIDSITKYQEGLCSKISKLQENVSSLQTSYNNLQETYQAYVDENELKLENLKTELAEVKVSLADLQANSDIDKAKIAELQTKITNLEKSIEEKNVSIEQLNSTIETQKLTIAELNKTITDLTNDLNSDLSQLNFYKNLMEGTVTEITAEDLKGVTKIRPYAFYGCLPLTSVEIGDSVVEICQNAFSCCIRLTNVKFSNGLEIINNYAFNNCIKLENLDFSNAKELKSIQYGAFSLRSNISNFEPWNWNDYNIDYVYSSEEANLRTLNLENCTNLEVLGADAFIYQTSLESIKLPSSSFSIGRNAFSYCISLTNITIPSNVANIDYGAFANCFRLVEVVNKSDLNLTVGSTENGYVAYYAKQVITDETYSKLRTDNNGFLIYDNTLCVWYRGTQNEVIIPNGITQIYAGAFYDNSQLIKVTIPNSVTSMLDSLGGVSVFGGCWRLMEIINKSSLNLTVGSTENGYVAYYAKQVITDEIYSKLRTDENGLLIYDNTLCVWYRGTQNEVIIPSGITEIYKNAFYENDNLKSVTIPNSVVTIGEFAFSYCKNLTKVIFEGQVPAFNYYYFQSSMIEIYDFRNCTSIPTLKYPSCFYVPSNGCKIYVPNSLLSQWKTATYWKNLTNVEWIGV